VFAAFNEESEEQLSAFSHQLCSQLPKIGLKAES
jgi:hypothetical protein